MAGAHALRIVHTSDLHVSDVGDVEHDERDIHFLQRVVAAAARLRADFLLLVGDTFDHNRLPARTLERAAAVLARSPCDVVALPGNHDPAMEACAFRHPALTGLDRLHVLGVNRPERVSFEDRDLEIWGRPHRDFGDMNPLEAPPPRVAGRRIVMAHGHYQPSPDRTIHPRPSWLFGDEELAACEADYMALGHWNRRARIGAERPPAWYSGSPELTESVNLCRLTASGVFVTSEPLI